MNNILEFSFMWDTFVHLLQFIPVTLFLAIISMLLASIIGLASAIVQLRNIPILKQIATVYLLIGRAVPACKSILRVD